MNLLFFPFSLSLLSACLLFGKSQIVKAPGAKSKNPNKNTTNLSLGGCGGGGWIDSMNGGLTAPFTLSNAVLMKRENYDRDHGDAFKNGRESRGDDHCA